MSWPSAQRARQLSTAAARYRSSFDIDAIDEGLSLLALGTKALKKHKPKHVRGPMTWAKIAEGVANAVGEALVNATDRDESKKRRRALQSWINVCVSAMLLAMGESPNRLVSSSSLCVTPRRPCSILCC